MNKPFLAFENISLSYGGRLLFKDFSLELCRGEKVVIEGKSGIGKSSLLRLLTGTARPDAGRLYYQGEVLAGALIWQLRREAALVGQEPDLGDATVISLLKQALEYKANRHLTWDMAAVQEEMAWLEMPETLLKEVFPKLSGGEKQRVLILLALLLKRDIFFLDEVTSALDKGLKKKIVDRFLGHPSWTVLAVSHDPGWAASDRARVITLEGP